MDNGITIRQALREATAVSHARLDRDLGSLDLGDRVRYAEFLAVQMAARRPIEQWIAGLATDFELPPPQTGLVESDLDSLGAQSIVTREDPFSASPDSAMGVAWALAGSSLGNRAMLASLRKRSAVVPTAFLSDPAMPAYFARLRPVLERPVPRETSLSCMIAGAEAVFACFLRAAAHPELKRAA